MKLETLYIDLLESKQTESQGLSILNKSNIKDANSVIKDFAEKDNSTNQKNIPLMAFFYSKGNANTELIISVANEYWELEKLKKLPAYRLEKGNILIGNKSFSDFIKFSEYIHAETNKNIVRQSFSVSKDFKTNVKPMWSGNGIDIYEGDSIEKCINYTQGGLTGKSYSFCIGKPGPQNMYRSYRDLKTSTYYFIVDRNRFKKNEDGTLDLTDPLHIVVFDKSNSGIELTDANNTTGTITEFGKDVNEYVKYLESKGVPVENLVNKPKTEKEEEEQKLLGRQNPDLNWFKELSYENKFNYIGRGHSLTDDQFDFLYDEGDDFLISKYADTGLSIPEYQLNKLTKGQKNTYIRKRLIATENGRFLEPFEVKLLTEEQINSYIRKRLMFCAKYDALLKNFEFDMLLNLNNNSLLSKYLDTKLSIPEYQVNKLTKEQKNIYIIKRLMGIDYGKLLEPFEEKLLTKEQGKTYLEKLTLSDEKYENISDDEKMRYICNISERGEDLTVNQYYVSSDDVKKYYIGEILESGYHYLDENGIDDYIYEISSDDVKKYYIEVFNYLNDEKLSVTPSELIDYYSDLVGVNFNDYQYESITKNFNSPIIEDLRKMKNLISYNSKTQ
jgi:hypothetical protein